MLIQIFVLKVINDGRKILTPHEIVDRIAEQIVLVITQVCKELKFPIRLTYGGHVCDLLTHLSSLTFVM